MKKITIVLVAIATMLGLAMPVLAHTWKPGDGGHNHSYKVSSDSWSNEPEWAGNDGRVTWKVSWYNHQGHVHVDHVRTTIDGNAGGGDDRLELVERQRVRMYKGICGSTFPNCRDNGNLGDRVWDTSMPKAGQDGVNYYKKIEKKFGSTDLFIVIDYRYTIDFGGSTNCCKVGQEEIQLLG